MAEHSKIEWTDNTFNPWWGCQKVSPACDHCYAETFSKRTGNAVWGKDAPRRFFGDLHWAEPLTWNKKAERDGVARKVFCGSMCDVLEDRRDIDEHRARLLGLIRQTPALRWLLLTKRPQNYSRLFRGVTLPANVWAGTTLENRDCMWRLDTLREVPAAVRFLSVEPLLEDLGQIDLTGIHWVIVGGESGPGARPMHPDWARGVRDQCVAAGVPFFFKQWGEWTPYIMGRNVPTYSFGQYDRMERVGKKAAGRLFDGREWSEFPEATHA